MPGLGVVLAQVGAVISMMLGERDAVRRLDTSRAGLYDSFFAIVYAVPFLGIGWLSVITDSGGAVTLANLPRFAFLDLVAWLLPIFAVVQLARTIGIEDRITHWVVAGNWAGLFFAVVFTPVTLMFSRGGATSDGIFLLLFAGVLYLSWRVQDAALNKGGRITFLCFGLNLIAGIVVSATLQNWLGLTARLMAPQAGP